MLIPRVVVLVALLVLPATAGASTFSHAVCAPSAADQVPPSGVDPLWTVQFGGAPVEPADTGSPGLAVALPRLWPPAEAQGTQRTKAIEYSHGYEVRRKIHVVASIATLPLFVTQVVIGQKLYDEPTDGMKTAHGIVAGATAGLFGVNTVTGVWNLWEGRKDPAHRGKRMAHGIMMLGADAGFVATGLLAPNDDDPNNYLDRRSTHRTVALTSMGVATASYLMMLFWK